MVTQAVVKSDIGAVATTPQEDTYWCFISYRHADNRDQDRDWASWLHQEIERYEVPAELVGTRNKRGDTIPERIYPVFRDEVSLPADADLASSIVDALDRSRYLVVLCSPRAVASRYVSDEILHFKRMGKQDRIITAIIDGEPGEPERECFPEPLRHPVKESGELDLEARAEPIAADFRMPDGSQGFTSAEAYRLHMASNGTLDKRQMKSRADAFELHLQLMKLKILSGTLGVPLEDLRNRDKAYQLEIARRRARVLRRWLMAVGALAVLLLVAGLLANQQRIRAEIQEFGALQQTLETSLELVSRFWTNGDVPQAVTGFSRDVTLARQIEAHPRATAREQARADLMARQVGLIRQGWQLLAEPEGVRDYAWSSDGGRLATLSAQGRLRLWDARTGQPIAQASTRLGDARRVRVTRGGERVLAAGDRAVQEANPLFVWQWDPRRDTVEVAFERGGSEEAADAVFRFFEIDPQGDSLAIDFLGLVLLKRSQTGEFEEVGSDATPVEISFDETLQRWLARTQDGFVAIDPADGQVTEAFPEATVASPPGDARLLQAPGVNYAYRFEHNGGTTARWMALSAKGPARVISLGSPDGADHGNALSFEVDGAGLGSNGKILVLPVPGGPDQRVDLYDVETGAFTASFRLPPGRSYERVRLSPGGQVMAAPAPDGLELWSPFVGSTVMSDGLNGGALETDSAGRLVVPMQGGDTVVLEIDRLRAPEDANSVMDVTMAVRWPDPNHLLVGFSDLKIGQYLIEPFERIALRTHFVDPASMTESQKFILRVEGAFLGLAVSSDGQRFASWSEYGGAQLWAIQNESPDFLAAGVLDHAHAVRFSPDGRSVWVMQGEEDPELSVFDVAQPPVLSRQIPVGFDADLAATTPDSGIGVVADDWPALIIDPATGMYLASFFWNGGKGRSSDVFRFEGVDSPIQLNAQGLQNVDVPQNEKISTGYRWNPDMTAPVPLSWSELTEAWRRSALPDPSSR